MAQLNPNAEHQLTFGIGEITCKCGESWRGQNAYNEAMAHINDHPQRDIRGNHPHELNNGGRAIG